MKELQQNQRAHVVKFGGVLMGSAENIHHSAKYVASQPKDMGMLTVVSAASGITDHLLQIADSVGEDGIDQTKRLTDLFYDRQSELVTSLRLSRKGEEQIRQELYTAYQNILIYAGISNLHPALRDSILSQGERISATVFTSTLLESGIPVKKIEAERVIVTNSNFSNASPDVHTSSERIRQIVGPRLQYGQHVVLPGFYGADSNSYTTVMPRNSSDLTAAIGAFALNAAELRLAKGIAGVYDKNPHEHDDAVYQEWLSYEDAIMISNNGGKVVYPDVMHLMRAKSIPIVVFDPRNPEQETIISELDPDEREYLRNKRIIFEVWGKGSSAEDLRELLGNIPGVMVSPSKFTHVANRLKAEEGIEPPDVRAKIRGFVRAEAGHDLHMGIFTSGVGGLFVNFFDPENQDNNRLTKHV